MDRQAPQPRRNTLRSSAPPPQAEPAAAAPARRKRWFGRRKRRILLLLLVVSTPLLYALHDRSPNVPKEEVAPAVAEAPAPKVLNCKVYPYKEHGSKLKDKLPHYSRLSQKAGIKPLADEKALEKTLGAQGNKLVQVRSTDAFWVAPMTHGRPYLTTNALGALHRIADDFKARIANTDLADARIKVTSLLRTRKDQRDLGRSNVNATKDQNAPHTHGTSMDLSYMKFVDQEGREMDLAACQQVFLAETLAEVIAEHRRQDKLLFATREARQACYHLSVCR